MPRDGPGPAGPAGRRAYIIFSFGKSCESTNPAGSCFALTEILPRCRSVSTISATARSKARIELRAHRLERGQFDVQNLAGLGQMAHGRENASGNGRLQL